MHALLSLARLVLVFVFAFGFEDERRAGSDQEGRLCFDRSEVLAA